MSAARPDLTFSPVMKLIAFSGSKFGLHIIRHLAGTAACSGLLGQQPHQEIECCVNMIRHVRTYTGIRYRVPSLAYWAGCSSEARLQSPSIGQCCM